MNQPNPSSNPAVSSKHPIDFEALRKGDVVPQDLIERIWLVKHADDPARYRFKQMDLCDQIMAARTDLWSRCAGNSILVMMDPEAEEYCAKRMADLSRALLRTAGHRPRIDTTLFSPAEKAESASRDRSFQLIALSTARDLRKANQQALLAGERVRSQTVGEGEEKI